MEVAVVAGVVAVAVVEEVVVVVSSEDMIAVDQVADTSPGYSGANTQPLRNSRW